MGKRLDEGWRCAFLGALARSGNVRLAARRAGVDHGTAYGIRARGQAVEDMPIEAVRDEVLRRIAAIRAHRERRGEGE